MDMGVKKMNKQETTNSPWNAPSERDRQDMPTSAFMGSGRRYPFKELINGRWTINLNALRSIIALANIHGETAIQQRASRMLERLKD